MRQFSKIPKTITEMPPGASLVNFQTVLQPFKKEELAQQSARCISCHGTPCGKPKGGGLVDQTLVDMLLNGFEPALEGQPTALTSPLVITRSGQLIIQTPLSDGDRNNSDLSTGCPNGNNPPDWFNAHEQYGTEEASKLVWNNRAMPHLVSSLCDWAGMCGQGCTPGVHGYGDISIGPAEHTFAMYGIEQVLAAGTFDGHFLAIRPKSARPEHVLIVGSGPSGLSAATWLVSRGISVTMLEGRDVAGGLLDHVIPHFKHAVGERGAGFVVNRLLDAHVAGDPNQKLFNLELNTWVTPETYPSLVEKFSAVMIAAGTPSPRKPNFPGAELMTIADDMLRAQNKVNFGNGTEEEHALIHVRGKKVLIYGIGDTALDVWRTSVRHMGEGKAIENIINALLKGASEIHIAYRGTSEKARANSKDFKRALEEASSLVQQQVMQRLKTVRDGLSKKNAQDPGSLSRIDKIIGQYPQTQNFVKFHFESEIERIEGTQNKQTVIFKNGKVIDNVGASFAAIGYNNFDPRNITGIDNMPMNNNGTPNLIPTFIHNGADNRQTFNPDLMTNGIYAAGVWAFHQLKNEELVPVSVIGDAAQGASMVVHCDWAGRNAAMQLKRIFDLMNEGKSGEIRSLRIHQSRIFELY